MTAGGDPWADPATPTHPGNPYAGPAPTAPPQHGQPYAQPYGQPVAYGYPGPSGPQPQGPRRPGQVITAAVLAFVQAGLVFIASLYLWFFASIAELIATSNSGMATGGPGFATDEQAQALATEGTVLALLQLVSAVLLIAAGVRALNTRNRSGWWLVLIAHAGQLVFVTYWAVRLLMFMDDGPGAEGAFASFSVFFAAAPVVSLGLLLTGTARGWFDGTRRS